MRRCSGLEVAETRRCRAVVGVERDDLAARFVPLHAVSNDPARSMPIPIAVDPRRVRRCFDARAVRSMARIASRVDHDDQATYGPAL
jgi:hypothetical protein